MSEWHLSKYTLFTKPSNHNFIVAVNLMKGSQTILFPNEVPLLMDFKKLDHEDLLFKKFKKQGLIVNYDELAIIDAMSKVNCKINQVSLTICPTLNCNFNCPYCFEKHLPGKMSEEVQNKIVSFAQKLIDVSKTNKLSIIWYGGEPLLAPDVIENLSNKLIKLCNDNKIYYKASIITNGYLLTQDIVDMLEKNRVFNYQITIDGVGEVHNKTRRLANGNGTFEQIIENLQNLKIFGRINIRHNIHKDNVEEINILKNLISLIKRKSGNNINYYSAIVVGNAAEEREGKVNLLDTNTKSKITLNNISNIFKCNAQFCGAQRLYNFVIDNNGKLYKCWEDVGKDDRSFGTIDTWNIKNPFFSSDNVEILTTYLNLAGCPNDQECRECIWLPICRGGCPSKRLFFEKQCLPYKNNPDMFISKVIEKNLKNWENKNIK